MGRKKNLSLWIGTIMMIVFFQNCGTEYNLQTAKEQSSVLDGTTSTSCEPTNTCPPSPPQAPLPNFVLKTQSFSEQTATKPVDMVWVFDNSYSMKEEANHVRTNFQKFMYGLKQHTDIHVAMISSTTANEYNTQVNLPPPVDANNLEINYFVDSFNPLLVAAASTCKPNEENSLCQILANNTRYRRVMGSLNQFFRDLSSKVFVFVTDDNSASTSRATSTQFDAFPEPFRVVEVGTLIENSHFISSTTFIQRMDSYFGQSSPYRVFGFIAKDNENCAARESREYKNVIAQKNGNYFNVCDTDWSPHFDQLAEQITTYAKTEYVLDSVDAAKLKRIVSVSLNNQALVLGEDYTVNGKQISLNPELVKMQNVYSVDVSYEEYVNY